MFNANLCNADDAMAENTSKRMENQKPNCSGQDIKLPTKYDVTRP